MKGQVKIFPLSTNHRPPRDYPLPGEGWGGANFYIRNGSYFLTALTQPLHSQTNTTTLDIVAKLWNLCNVLKDDGVTYHQYVTELTYLLFLKMAKETNTEGD